MRFHRLFAFCLPLIVGIALVSAQDATCPAIVQTALQTADQACTSLGRNQACYGNIALNAVPQTSATNFTFAKAGDIVNITDIQSLALSSLDAQKDEWGVALMKVQANLPDTLPGQNVTFLLFGDVAVQNAPAAANTPEPTATPAPTATPVVVEITPNNKVNVRGEPSTSGALVSSLPKGQSVQADGRNDGGDWLHVQLADGSSGWVFAQLVTVSGDASALPVIGANSASSETTAPTEEAPAAPVYGPMQAFYFKTGANDSPCAEAPDSGILIQTPQGAGKIDLVMDGVNVSLGSTVYVQAQPSGEMVITVVEGQATVSAFGTTVVVPAGTRAHIPLDANLTASGAPVGPEGYDASKLTALPVSHLPQVVTVAPPLTADQIAALGPIVPLDGQWTISGTSTSDNPICDKSAGGIIDYSSGVSNAPTQVFSTPTRFQLAGVTDSTFQGLYSDPIPVTGSTTNPTITVSGDGTYTIHDETQTTSADGTVQGTVTYVIKVVSPVHIEGVTTLSFTFSSPQYSFGCNVSSTYTMDYVTDATGTGGNGDLSSSGSYNESHRLVAARGGGLTDADCESQPMPDAKPFEDFINSHTNNLTAMTPGSYQSDSATIQITWVSHTRIDGMQMDTAQPGCVMLFTITPIKP